MSVYSISTIALGFDYHYPTICNFYSKRFCRKWDLNPRTQNSPRERLVRGARLSQGVTQDLFPAQQGTREHPASDPTFRRSLESGALDRSAIPTFVKLQNCGLIIIKF